MQETSPVILLKNNSYVVGYKNGGHVLYRDGEIAYQGNRVIYAGKKFAGKADQIIDTHRGFVMPGLVNCHCHVAASPVEKGFLEDIGSRNFYGTSLYESLRVTHLNIEDQEDVFRFSLSEILKKGSTTIFELGRATEPMIETIAKSGIRAYVGPMARSCVFMTQDGKTVHYEWDEPEAFRRLQYTVDLHEKYSGKFDDRIRIALYPGQADCVTPDFLKEVRKAADATGMRIQIHAAQSINEIQVVMERHGMIPAQFLHENGICGPDTLYSHYIMPCGSTLNGLRIDNELELIANDGTTVVNCPWVYGRRGFILESFYKYRKLGINLAIGTDSFPQDMVHEMRAAAIFGKIAEYDTWKCTAADVFNAATLGGAKALGREDIGRLCEGSKADIVVVSTQNMEFMPLRDPIKVLVYTEDSHNIDKVIVDGKMLVDDGELLGIEEKELYSHVQAAGEHMWENVAKRDWKGRSHDEMSPMSFPVE